MQGSSCLLVEHALFADTFIILLQSEKPYADESPSLFSKERCNPSAYTRQRYFTIIENIRKDQAELAKSDLAIVEEVTAEGFDPPIVHQHVLIETPPKKCEAVFRISRKKSARKTVLFAGKYYLRLYSLDRHNRQKMIHCLENDNML